MRAVLIVFAISILLCACGGGDDDQREPPDKTIGPVQCAASAVACARSA
jgi:hypothetical protein